MELIGSTIPIASNVTFLSYALSIFQKASPWPVSGAFAISTYAGPLFRYGARSTVERLTKPLSRTLSSQSPFSPMRVMLSQGRPRSAGELGDVDHQILLTHGTDGRCQD